MRYTITEGSIVKFSFVHNNVLYHLLDDKTVIISGSDGEVIEHIEEVEYHWDCETNEEDWYITIGFAEKVHLSTQRIEQLFPKE